MYNVTLWDIHIHIVAVERQ